MTVHSPSSRFERFRRWWHRVFFWQSAQMPNHEIAPPNAHDRHLVAAITTPNSLPGWRQMRYVTYVFSERERTRFWTAILGTVLFFSISAGLFLQPHIVQQPTYGGVLTEGLIGTPKWINPVLDQMNAVDADISSLVFSGLFRASGLVVRPDLAQSFQLLDQGKAIEVRIREDARFHDGQPVTADDVVFTINDAIKNPAWRSPLASSFSDIEAIRIDEFTLQIKHKEQPLHLRQWQDLLTVGVLPAHRWADVNEGSPQLAEGNLKPVGSGPYQFATFTRDAKGLILAYTLKGFSGYYGDKPHLAERVFRFYPDRRTAELALESNQIESLAFVPWGSEDKLRMTGGATVSIELPQVTTIFLNTRDAILKELPVRKALSLAVDRGELVRSLNHGTPLQSTFPFLESYATSSQLTNIDEARQLLENARWKADPATGLRYLQPAPLAPSRGRTQTNVSFVTTTPLTLSVITTDQSDLVKIAEAIKRQWSLLGAQVTLETLERNEMLRRALNERSHQAVISNIMASTDADLLPFWATNGSLNISQWSQSNVSADLLMAEQASSTDALVAARRHAAETLSTHIPAIFLLRPSYAYVLPSTLRGAQNLQILRPSGRFDASLQWYTRTKFRWKNLP